jgi:hypothetical protein
MPLMFCPCCSYLLLLTTCLHFNHKIYVIIEKVALYSNTNTAKHMTLYIQCFAYVIATCFYFNHLNQIKVVLYCHTIKLQSFMPLWTIGVNGPNGSDDCNFKQIPSDFLSYPLDSSHVYTFQTIQVCSK